MNQRGNRFCAGLVVVMLLAIMLQGCGPGSGQADGTHVEKVYWPGGKLRREVTMKDSLRHGPSRNYYRSGRLRLATEWEQGTRVGEAVTYYEDGAVYQVTPFVAGTRHGIQRRYYPGGELMAEMPYSNGELAEGLREYDQKGQLLTPEAHIVFELREQPGRQGSVELLMRLSDGCTKVQFSRYMNDALQGRGEHYPLITQQGRVGLRLNPATEGSPGQAIYVRAERPSPLGNKEIFQGEYIVGLAD